MLRQLAAEINSLTCALRCLHEHNDNPNDNTALRKRFAELESSIMIKVSKIKADVAELRKNNAEALGELGTRIGKLDKQLADLVAANADPEVTDETFEADLAAAKDAAAQLAAIVPNPATPTPPASPA